MGGWVDWTEAHEGPPSLAGATTLVESNRRLLFRGALPTGIPAVLLGWAAWEPGHWLPSHGAPLVVAGALLAVSLVRVWFWSRGFGARKLVATSTHLVACTGDRVVQWVPWSEVDRLVVVPSSLLPEWSRNGNWFMVAPQPDIAVMPPAAFLGGLGDMLLSARASTPAAERVCRAADAQGIRTTIL